MRVSALFRHPIKSHGRERIETVHLTAGQTMPWDRHWAITHDATKFDPDAPAWAHCRNFMIGALTPGLAGIWATLDEASGAVTLRHEMLGEITFDPDNPADAKRFLDWVAPVCPADRDTPNAVVKAPGRGMTDSGFPSVSIMTHASHDAVVEALGSPLEIERWRGNIWLEGAATWAELEWLGRPIRIGDAVLQVKERIKRCSLTNTNPVTGLRDTDTLGALNGAFGHQDFGVYAEVLEGGDIAIDDTAELI